MKTFKKMDEDTNLIEKASQVEDDLPGKVSVVYSHQISCPGDLIS